MAITMDEVRSGIVKAIRATGLDDHDYYTTLCNVPVPEKFADNPEAYAWEDGGYAPSEMMVPLDEDSLADGHWTANAVIWGAVSGDGMTSPAKTFGDAVRIVATFAACNDTLDNPAPEAVTAAYARACDSLESGKPDATAVETVRAYTSEAFTDEKMSPALADMFDDDSLPEVARVIRLEQRGPGKPVEISQQVSSDFGRIVAIATGSIPEKDFKAGDWDASIVAAVFNKPIEGAASPRP